jgi:hypothetical protein
VWLANARAFASARRRGRGGVPSRSNSRTPTTARSRQRGVAGVPEYQHSARQASPFVSRQPFVRPTDHGWLDGRRQRSSVAGVLSPPAPTKLAADARRSSRLGQNDTAAGRRTGSLSVAGLLIVVACMSPYGTRFSWRASPRSACGRPQRCPSIHRPSSWRATTTTTAAMSRGSEKVCTRRWYYVLTPASIETEDVFGRLTLVRWNCTRCSNCTRLPNNQF